MIDRKKARGKGRGESNDSVRLYQPGQASWWMRRDVAVACISQNTALRSITPEDNRERRPEY